MKKAKKIQAMNMINMKKIKIEMKKGKLMIKNHIIIEIKKTMIQEI